MLIALPASADIDESAYEVGKSAHGLGRTPLAGLALTDIELKEIRNAG